MSTLETLSLLIHAGAKVGKSTLAMTGPAPMLVLDAEGSTKFIPLRKIGWNPMQGPPPIWDGTWDACIVNVTTFEDMSLAYNWLVTGQHSFQTVTIDSISEVQRKLKQKLAGTEAMKMQHWGELLTKMDILIRQYRDLTLHPTHPIRVAVFVAETRIGKAGKWVPYMQGQIEGNLPYWVDVVGYLSVVPHIDMQTGQQYTDERGQPAFQRHLLTGPHPMFETGERVQGRLPHTIINPNITEMYLTVFPHLAQPAAPAAQVQYTYPEGATA